MATDIEAAYVRLKAVLQSAAAASDALPNLVTRNETLRGLFGELEGSSKGYLNLVDEDPNELAELIGEDGAGEVEFYQLAAVEWIVREIDPELRDARFDEGISALAAAIRAARSDPAWDSLEVFNFEKANLSTGALPGVKAGRISLGMLFTAPDVLGNII